MLQRTRAFGLTRLRRGKVMLDVLGSVFWEFWDEKRFSPIFAATLDQERAQVPLWGPAPMSGATVLRLG